MAFYKTPIFEEPPTCLVCSVVVTDGSLICSATCEDMQAIMGAYRAPVMDWEGLGEFIAEQHEPTEFDCV